MIAIIMATFNGEKYLPQQLDSILTGSQQNFKLFIFDDASSDSTPDILKEYQQSNPDKIKLTLRTQPTGSAKANFAFAFTEIPKNYDYYFFCDQDDIWHSNKIELTISKFTDNTTPQLVHTDLNIVDSNLNLISNSFYSYQKLNPNRNSLKNLLSQNIAVGCTICINKPLAEKIGNIPNSIPMHDWWIILTARLFGEISYLSTATIDYRQHEANSVGSQKATGLKYVAEKASNEKTVTKNSALTFTQAQLLLDNFGDSISNENQKIINKYCNIRKKSKLLAPFRLIFGGFCKNTLTRTLGQIYSILKS